MQVLDGQARQVSLGLAGLSGWARLPRLVFGATSYDVAVNGFEDLQLYRELTYPAEQRQLRGDAVEPDLREQAADVLRSWAERLPFPVEPKL